MPHTIEFLKKARELGATHVSETGVLYKISGEYISYLRHGSSWFKSCMTKYYISSAGIVKIDFTPLDDYYADKALDIRATGVGE